MATPNYGYEKRQRELAKKKKKEDKLRSKAVERRPDQGGYAPQPEHQEQAQDGSDRSDGSVGTDPASAAPTSTPNP